jgi:hypothetical protein
MGGDDVESVVACEVVGDGAEEAVARGLDEPGAVALGGDHYLGGVAALLTELAKDGVDLGCGLDDASGLGSLGEKQGF